jgi:NTE family protein
MRQSYQDELLAHHLQTLFGDLDDATMALLRSALEWVEVPAGQVLMAQGEPGDSMYLSISGRLRAYVRDDDGAERMVREMARGQVVGELSLYTDAPRSATVVAVRDSVLVRLGKDAFHRLLAQDSRVSVALTRQIIQRLQHPLTRSALSRPVTMALVPISAGVSIAPFAQRLAQALRPAGRACVVDAERVDRELGSPGAAIAPDGDTAMQRRIMLLLDQLEATHDFVLLVADEQPTPWTRRCRRSSDEVLLLADAAQAPVLHPNEPQDAEATRDRAAALEVLVLLHPADTRHPRGTRAWLERRPVQDHLHVRPAVDRDMARLARVQSRTAVGLVLAGGGARGLAHLGVYQALQERGIEVDFLGGTSLGGIMASLLAADEPVGRAIDVARRAFKQNPTGDYNLLPLLSLIAGRRLKRVVTSALDELFGFDVQVEDLWKNAYLVASNYSKGREQVIRQGPLNASMRASAAIPGALPPVLADGELLCDGGTFNNFPVDLMRTRRGVGQVIGVDLSWQGTRRFRFTEVPGPWALALDMLRPRRRRRFRLPSLVAYLMRVTILYSVSRQAESKRLTDLYFNPPLERVGMLQWHKFDSIVRQGYEHAMARLDELGTAGVALPEPEEPTLTPLSTRSA